MDSESTDKQQCAIQVCLLAVLLLERRVFLIQFDFSSNLSVLYSNLLFSFLLCYIPSYVWPVLYVGVFACVCWSGPAGVTAPVRPCVEEKKQHACLNNVKSERRGGSESKWVSCSWAPTEKHFTINHKKHTNCTKNSGDFCGLQRGTQFGACSLPGQCHHTGRQVGAAAFTTVSGLINKAGDLPSHHLHGYYMLH